MPYPAHYRIPDRSPHTELPILLDHVYKTIIRIIKISRNIEKSKIRMTFDGIFLARPTLKLPKNPKKLVKSHSYFGLHNNSKYQSLTVRRSGIAKDHPPCSHLPKRIGRMAGSTMMLKNINKDHH